VIVSGTATDSQGHKGEFFTDLAFVNEPEKPPVVVEPLRRVSVKEPFLVAHEGMRFYPGDVAEVPESVALHWRANGWVILLEREGVKSEPVKQTGGRGNRPQPG
jgi:hypothetical protein